MTDKAALLGRIIARERRAEQERTTAQLQARRDAKAAELAQAQQEHAQIEQMLQQSDRQLCAMYGALQELDALLKGE